jgi:hypothetical protein
MEESRKTEFRCIDPNGVIISCHNWNWAHLINHKELIGQQGVVKAVIESPDFINNDVKHKNRTNYYKLLILPRIGSTYVRITVQKPILLSRKRGVIITGYACNGEKKGEVRLWSKN